MTWITTIAISNAVATVLLGPVAYVVGRRAKSAAVGHALWVVVLVKFITPPILEFPLPILPPSSVSPNRVQPESAGIVADTTSARSTRSQNSYSVVGEPQSSGSTGVTLHTAQTWLFRIWIWGALGYGLYQLYVTWQMCRLMRLAKPDCRIDRAMHRIAKRANVKNYPTARVVPWVGSPMLWGLGGTSVIVLPEQLFDSLDDQAADTLMQHELAHFQRGDQWIRILEVITSTLFWWHPIVWLAIREIEVYEEQCCDAWVVRQDRGNRRRYAEALLDTVDFISDAPDSARPIGASGLGRVPLLQQRIKSIMNGDQQLLGVSARLGILLMVALVPLQPRLLQAHFRQPTVVAFDNIASNNESHLSHDPLAGFVAGVKQHREKSLAEKVQSRVAIPEIEYAIADSVYGTYQLIATSGYRVRLKEVVKGSIVDLNDYRISCAAFAPPTVQAPRFAAGCLDGSIHVFDCMTGEPTRLLAKYGGVIHSIAYSRTGLQLAAGGEDGLVHIINLTDGSTRSLEESFGIVRSVRFSPDGQKLAVATDTTWRSGIPGRVDIWNAELGTHERTINCPSAVGVAGFNAVGNILTAEWNGTLRIWSADGRHLLTQLRPKDSISAAAFSQNAITLETLSEME